MFALNVKRKGAIMKDQPRKLVAQDGYWLFVTQKGDGSTTVVNTGIPSSTPRKQAAAELKARNG